MPYLKAYYTRYIGMEEEAIKNVCEDLKGKIGEENFKLHQETIAEFLCPVKEEEHVINK